ncbi:MAG: response regulator [Prolixibacteraceae bacterium]|nr:response regulator [Prolixibacteraceae bacterium]
MNFNLSKSKLLVVDDDPFVIEFVTNVLIDYQYDIMAAYDGEAAIRIVEKEHPDLIIMDWEMPRKNGIETIRHLKSKPEISDIPVIMITGRMNTKHDLKAAFDAGAIDFIHKPIEPIELIARTNSMLLLYKYYKESIRNKDWELTLLSNSVHHNEKIMNQMTEMCNKLEDAVQVVDVEKYRKIRSKIKQLGSNLNNNTWEHFQLYFKNVYPNFIDHLLNDFPKLTPEEIKLCHFLRMNMSTKEIASITNKEIHSIDIARYRLRKKLNLERDVKFNEFLQQY